MNLFQFFDPSMAGPYLNTAILVGMYFLLKRDIAKLDTRLRGVENHLSRLEGREGREK
jgi:hypothetical protein